MMRTIGRTTIKRAGFTLIEVLSVAAIVTILGSMLLTTMAVLRNTYHRNNTMLELKQGARLAMEHMVKELQQSTPSRLKVHRCEDGFCEGGAVAFQVPAADRDVDIRGSIYKPEVNNEISIKWGYDNKMTSENIYYLVPSEDSVFSGDDNEYANHLVRVTRDFNIPDTCDDGNDTCDAGEDAQNCCYDCPKESTLEFCDGDGECCGEETVDNCCEECHVCGDEICDSCEDCSTCENDCGECPPPPCGDGTCDTDEDCITCEADCGPCSACNFDGDCDDGETVGNCCEDCHVCGNHVCESCETSHCSDCTACFLGGTPILMADGSVKPIEDIQVGDAVISFDPDTNELLADAVHETTRHTVGRYLIINKDLQVTPSHSFYSNGQWVEAGQLRVGDMLLNAQGQDERIFDIARIDKTAEVYNFEVNPVHTYFAGGYLVHNKNPIRPPYGITEFPGPQGALDLIKEFWLPQDAFAQTTPPDLGTYDELGPGFTPSSGFLYDIRVITPNVSAVYFAVIGTGTVKNLQVFIEMGKDLFGSTVTSTLSSEVSFRNLGL